MALPVNRSSNEMPVHVTMADLSTEDTVGVVAPIKGYVVRAYSCIKNAITGADAAWTLKINGNAVALATTVTVTQAGSAAFDVDSAEIGIASDNYVNAGDSIQFYSNGSSSTTCITTFTAVIEAH